MFKISELPYKQFEKIGMSEKDVKQLPTRTLNALLSGQRTDLIKFTNVPNIEGGIEGKLSIKKGIDGNPVLSITPVRQTPEIKYNLTDKEVKFLRDNDNINFIPKEFKDKNNKPYKVLVTLDKDTNTFIAFKQEAIKPPLEINNTLLSEQQKLDFKKGKPIEINGDKFMVNPTTELGISNQFGDTRKIKQLKTENYNYDAKQLMMDIALSASSIGSVVMLGHLMRIVNTTMTQHRKNSQNPQYEKSIENIDKQIKDYAKANNVIPNEVEIKKIVNNNLQNHNLGIYDGKLIDHGKAPYKNDPNGAESYFIKVEQNGKENTLWGKDFQQAIEKTNVQKGDDIKIEYQGKVQVMIPTKEILPDGNQKVVEKNTFKNLWDIYKADKQEGTTNQKNKVAETDNIKTAKQGNTTSQKSSHPTSIKDSNPEIKKTQVAKKTSKLSNTPKPKAQEKQSRAKGIKM